MACGTSRSTGESNGSGDFEDLITKREFEIENEWLMPLGGSMVNLIGNANYIRVKGDSVDVFLPYYGVRHSGGGYGSEGGIRYEGVPKNFNITHNEQKNNYMLKFEGNHESENLQFMITIFPNGDTNTSVNSSQRASISYRGD
ncbi:DUF4251 domain-containing protein [Antarcticibacterium sp. 1MA-6-2]|uniref:DUF4251 domain-containing protein n=1 Tax=Antarcticibacterium sp. 1MA-6-2 TaxID=2908210 RepID=UPI001F3DDB08|nr:DUF4251 domain-containing protein [Antarcticibacterium sp. 1MA-6-2]UJH91602.1 DUF4251 domain-containing protein [Antarcticibacterium sp. 1MA-6-2]